MRGRKPKSTVMKLVQNNPGRRPINKDEPKPDSLDVACPAELTDPVSQREWADTIVPAIERRQITSAERVMAIAHCELWGTWRSQVIDAARHPHVVATGANKYPTPNPARGMANKTLQLLLKVDAELGLTPTSRTRVTATGAPISPANPLARFMAKKAT